MSTRREQHRGGQATAQLLHFLLGFLTCIFLVFSSVGAIVAPHACQASDVERNSRTSSSCVRFNGPIRQFLADFLPRPASVLSRLTTDDPPPSLLLDDVCT